MRCIPSCTSWSPARSSARLDRPLTRRAAKRRARGVPLWRNGRRERLKIVCRKTCPFESGQGHQSAARGRVLNKRKLLGTLIRLRRFGGEPLRRELLRLSGGEALPQQRRGTMASPILIPFGGGGLSGRDPFLSLHREMNRLFDDTFRSIGPGARQGAAAFSLRSSTSTKAQDEFCVTVDLPDVAESDLDLQLEGDLLTIRGEKKQRGGARRTRLSRDGALLGHLPALAAAAVRARPREGHGRLPRRRARRSMFPRPAPQQRSRRISVNRGAAAARRRRLRSGRSTARARPTTGAERASADGRLAARHDPGRRLRRHRASQQADRTART